MSFPYTRGAFARRNYFTLILISSFMLLGSCLAAFAQGGVGSSRGLPGPNDGIHTIKGRVYFPVETKGDKHLRVTLKSADTTDETTTTDEDGSFAFNRLRAGNYMVIVNGGKEFDDATESASIDREASSGGRIVNLSIALRARGTAEAYSKIPKAARDLYSKGTEAAAKGDSKKAVEHLSGAVAAYPEFPQALGELGVQYLKLGQPDKAAESLQAALKLTPGDMVARLNYGFALLSQKKFDEAEAELREVLKKNDAMPTAHMYLGITLMNQKKLDDAEAELTRAATSNSAEVATAHRYLGGILWGKREYKRAADELETYLKLAPKAPDAERTRAAIKELRSKQ
ncbi:MAG TPA: tetratricopeptide repeat protein [Pyrinomonadaceae bacterium]|nr:tetratricopeptide repeat protein [Pyrinomonadaceae bacterium]